MTAIGRFVDAVTEQFGLGDGRHVSVDAMTGSANRLWRFDVGAERYVVKELSHDRVEQLARRRRAAAFEGSVFASGDVVMPEPIVDRDGEVVTVVDGSRGGPCLVRVHRWIDGRRPAPVTAPVAAAAGRALAVIHRHGRVWSREPMGSLRWWEVDPLDVIRRLPGSPLADLSAAADARAREALDVIADGEAVEGDGIFTHGDHKPQNAFVVGDDAIAVLDWDECRHCHPRLDAVDAALRWSAEAGDDARQRDAFIAFVDEYGGIGAIAERDFAKWVADLLAWFSFQARRVLGDWPTDARHERAEAEAMARAALVELEHTLRTLSTWAAWV